MEEKELFSYLQEVILQMKFSNLERQSNLLRFLSHKACNCDIDVRRNWKIYVFLNWKPLKGGRQGGKVSRLLMREKWLVWCVWSFLYRRLHQPVCGSDRGVWPFVWSLSPLGQALKCLDGVNMRGGKWCHVRPEVRLEADRSSCLKHLFSQQDKDLTTG